MSIENSEVKRPQVNPNVFESLLFTREVSEWTSISHALNLLITYALPAMATDDALADIYNQECIQELCFFKKDIDQTIIYTLSNIPD